ncbi:cation transporter [Photobacterium sp. DNB23_23_1]
MLSDRRFRTSLLSIIAEIGLTGTRIALAIFTGSAALLADAYHSVTDFSVSVILLLCLIIRLWCERTNNAKLKARAGTIESYSVMAVSVVILMVPFQLLQTISGIDAGDIGNLWIGIFGVLGIIILNLFFAKLKVHVGKETNTLSIEADGHHTFVDLMTSVAVLCSLIGLLIGINIDELIAIAIGVMIWISGVELFFSGYQSLKQGEWTESSLFGLLTRYLPIDQWRQTLAHTQLKQRLLNRKSLGSLAAIAFSLYMATGLTIIPHGYSGIKHRLFAIVDTGLQPGLHYHLPQPLGSIVKVSEGDVRTVTISPNQSSYTRRAQQNQWFQIVPSRAHLDDTDYLHTGDDSLIFIEMALQYRLLDAAGSYYDYQDIDQIITNLGENALWQHAATTKYEGLLLASQDTFSNKLIETLSRNLDQLDIPVEVTGAYIQKSQPPASMVKVYRDVLNAFQTSHNAVNVAIGERWSDLPLAQAQINIDQARIEAKAVESVLHAEGDADHFTQLANVHKDSPEALYFELGLRASTAALANKHLTITDSRIDRQDFRVWQLPLQLEQQPQISETE